MRLTETKHFRKRTIKTPLIKGRVEIINNVIKKLLNESFESEIPTEYEIVKEDSRYGGEIIIYRFKTNSGSSYDLEFIYDLEHKNVVDVEVFKTISGNYKINGSYVEIIDLAFVPSEINMEDRYDNELYTKETNRQETFELMGRISYLVKEFINNNPKFGVYVIGKNTKEMKLSIYNKMYENIFSNDFIKMEGYNYNYTNDGSFDFIKKK